MPNPDEDHNEPKPDEGAEIRGAVDKLQQSAGNIADALQRTVTTAEKLRAVQRELALRKNVYPRFVANGKITQQQADHETLVMSAIIADYEAMMKAKP